MSTFYWIFSFFTRTFAAKRTNVLGSLFRTLLGFDRTHIVQLINQFDWHLSYLFIFFQTVLVQKFWEVDPVSSLLNINFTFLHFSINLLSTIYVVATTPPCNWDSFCSLLQVKFNHFISQVVFEKYLQWNFTTFAPLLKFSNNFNFFLSLHI